MEDQQSSDICRVCRSEGQAERPLFHPCICTGSIKWIHQECLTQWMHYSRKEYCELCSHHFSFTPIYSPNMPRRLPVKDVVSGLLHSVGTAVVSWLHYTLVAIAWLGVVPLAVCRIYRCFFTVSLDSVLTLPMDILSLDNIASDVFHGCFVVTCTLFSFIGLVWLREQILHGGGPDWLERDNNAANAAVAAAAAGAGAAAAAARAMDEDEMQDVVQPEGAVQVQPDGDADLDLNQAPPPPPPQMPAVEVEELPPPVPPPQADGAAAAAAAAADEINWNPMDWERGPEEITWERLLGLDGSLAFVEHVFWVVSLNALFILMFAFIPYHIGHIALGALGLQEHASAAPFEGLVTTLFGYCIIGLALVLLHALVSFCGMPRTQRILGFCYVVVKVSLLSVVEVTVLPLICGWWLDICSLAVFDATLKDREASFRHAPGTSLFIHWMVGMVYVYYFTSFVLLLREVLRPGVLWFLRNLNEPDFNPIQEMIHLPFLLHIRRLLVSTVTLGTVVMLVLWLPVRILRAAWPSFLPYTVSVHSDTQTNELSLELLLLQVILPALLEQSHTRTWVKGLVGAWCRAVAVVLDLHSYLLGDDPPKTSEGSNQNENEQQAAGGPAWPAGEMGLGGGGLGVIHQAIVQQESPVGFRPYVRPSLFGLRLVGLFLAMCVSLVIASVVVLTVPVWLGRHVMSMWVVGSAPTQVVAGATARHGTARVHELYTAACGIYLCWLGARAVSLLLSWLPQGRAAMMSRVRQWCILGAKALVAFTVLLGVIPMLFGLLLELVVIVPLRVALDQSAVLFVWQDWALGVLYTKIACAVTMLGPDWVLRRAIERAYHEGIRAMDLRFILKDLAAPVIFCFGLALSVPYATAHGIVPMFITCPHLRNLIARRIYPFLLLVVVVAGIVSFQVRQFRKLYNHIKDSKYLVGRQLVNYDHRRHKANTAKAQ